MAERRRLTLTLVAQGDILMRDRQRRSNVLESDPFIRGSVLRGSLADAWIRTRGINDEFRRVFVGGTSFRGGYPLVPFRLAGPDLRRTMTMPRTVFMDKEIGRFVDLAYDDAPDTAGFSRHSGLAEYDAATNGASPIRSLPTYARQRIGTRQDGTGLVGDEEGRLFTEVVVASGTQFEVEIDGAVDNLERVASLLEEPAVDGFLSIGRSRTILGLVGVSERNIGDIESDLPRAGSRHALYFATDAVLLDDHLEPVLPDAQWLERLVGLEGGTVFDVDQSYLSERRIAGWSAVHGGPKPIDSTIERGSVLPFSCSDNDALTRIADRLRSGVGWRAAEGFGVIRIDHPIHAASWPTAEAPAGAVQDDIAEFAREVATALRSESNDRIGYSLWSTYREASPMPRQPRERSEHPQAASTRLANVARVREGERKLMEDARRDIERRLAEREGSVDTESVAECVYAIGRELLLAEGLRRAERRAE